MNHVSVIESLLVFGVFIIIFVGRRSLSLFIASPVTPFRLRLDFAFRKWLIVDTPTRTGQKKIYNQCVIYGRILNERK